jgi:DNA adenine methylase
MKPFLRWIGGKQKIASKVLAEFPSESKWMEYREPFLGMGSLLLKLSPRRAAAGDQNPYLANCWLELKKNPAAVVGIAEELAAKDSREEFKKEREALNSLSPDFGADLPSNRSLAGRFLYLMKSCYNGLWRVNSKGEFNATWIGVNPDFNKENIFDVSRWLNAAGAEIFCRSWEWAAEDVIPGETLIYFDPPYMGTFDGYSSKGFGKEEHAKLAEGFKKASAAGAACLLSNSDHPFIRELYKNFNAIEIYAPRSFRHQNSNRPGETELLIKNF